MDQFQRPPADNTLFPEAQRTQALIHHPRIKQAPPEEDSDLAAAIDTARESWTTLLKEI